MKYYINLRTNERTQATSQAFLWYRNGANIAIVQDGKIINKWVHTQRIKGTE